MALSDEQQLSFDFNKATSHEEEYKNAMAQSARICNTVMRNRNADIEYTKAFLSTMTSTRSQINTTIDGQKGYKPVAKSDSIRQQREHLWVLKG